MMFLCHASGSVVLCHLDWDYSTVECAAAVLKWALNVPAVPEAGRLMVLSRPRNETIGLRRKIQGERTCYSRVKTLPKRVIEL